MPVIEPTAADLQREPEILLALKGYDGFPAPKSFEGLVGAVVFNGSHFVTSPNMDHIWAPPINPQMTFKHDMRLGDDDPLLWPQPFLRQFSHFPAIRRKPANLSPTALYHIVFYELQDFDCQLVHDGVLSGLYNLTPIIIRKLKSFIDIKVEKKLVKYREGPHFENNLMFLESLHCLSLRTISHLQSLPMSRRQVHFLFAELQRYLLEFTAAHDYITLYRPRMKGHLPAATEVAKTIGAFVQTPDDAEDFFRAGLPVWFIRPAKLAGTIRVDELCELRRPQGFLCLNDAYDHFPVVYRGLATNPAKYLTFGSYARNYLSYGNAFELRISTSAAPLPRSEPRSRHSPYPKSKKTGHSYKLEEPVSDRLPLSLQPWITALAHLNTDPGRARLCGSSNSQDARGYVVPNPMLFFGTAEDKRHKFFYNWLRYRSALLYRITDWRNSPLNGQMWREFLHLANDSQHHPYDSQHHPSTSSKLSSQPTKGSGRKEVLREMLKLCTQNSNDVQFINSSNLPSDVHWKTRTFAVGDIPDVTSSKEIIWELAELNFRAELRSLDQHLHRPNPDEWIPSIANYSREDEILFCLAGSQSTGIFVADINLAGSGIAAADWMMRRSYILALKNLMSTWDGFSQAAQSARADVMVRMATVLTFTEEQYLEFENSLVHLYVQYFFDCFDRPPTIPRRLDIV